MSVAFSTTNPATPNHSPKRTAPAVTLTASAAALPSTVQPARQSFAVAEHGSLGGFRTVKTVFVVSCLCLSLVVLALAEKPIEPADVVHLREKRELHNAVLLNNFEGRLMDQKTKTLKGDLAGLGRPVNPKDVMIIAEAMVPDDMVKLYTSIRRLPDSADVVRILYTVSADRKKATLIGYTVEMPRGTDIAFVRYDGSAPWLEWITKSFSTINPKPESKASPPKQQ